MVNLKTIFRSKSLLFIYGRTSINTRKKVEKSVKPLA